MPHNVEPEEGISQNNKLDRITVAKTIGVHRARISFVVAVAERRQIAAHQRLPSNNGAFATFNILLVKLGRIVGGLAKGRLLVRAERVVDCSPQAPAGVTGFTLVHKNITSTNSGTLNFDVKLVLEIRRDLAERTMIERLHTK